jgi:uncharacterized protein (TIGR00661 family)
MRILYGVVGEGMGHAMRSRVLIEHLLKEGHEVEIMASSRAEQYLNTRFQNVHKIHGFHIISEENRVRRGKTVLSNILKGAQGIPRQLKAYFQLTEDFAPETVISDFESWSWLYGESHRLPVFSVDNMQIIDRCTLPLEVIKGQRQNFEITRTFIRGKLPFSEYFFITTFFYPPIKRDRTSLFAPILRSEILNAKPSAGDHLLVYQNSTTHGRLLEALASTGMECRIYGMKRDLQEDLIEGNLCHRPFNEAQFIEDLASAKGVIGCTRSIPVPEIYRLCSDCDAVGRHCGPYRAQRPPTSPAVVVIPSQGRKTSNIFSHIHTTQRATCILSSGTVANGRPVAVERAGAKATRVTGGRRRWDEICRHGRGHQLGVAHRCTGRSRRGTVPGNRARALRGDPPRPRPGRRGRPGRPSHGPDPGGTSPVR